MTDAIQQLIDKSIIHDVVMRYARSVDRRDWESARAAFFEDATDHHGDFFGSREQFIDWVSGNHSGVPKSTHLLGNCLIEFGDENLAVVETYFFAVLELSASSEGHRKMFFGDDADASASGRVRMDVLGRYVDRFEKRDGQWRIAKRVTVFDSTHARPNIGTVDDHPRWALGKRDAGDPLFAIRRAAGLGD